MQTVSKEYVVDGNRWIMLFLFSILTICNGLFWVTFSPISDLTQLYIAHNSDGPYNNLTSVNMLANIFLIMYLPGTLLTNIWRKSYGLKKSLELSGLLSLFGAFVRFVPTLFYNYMSSSSIFYFLFLGQFLAAVTQPYFCNIPPGVSNVWFPESERDLATAIGSIASPVGNAISALISVTFVHFDIDLSLPSNMTSMDKSLLIKNQTDILVSGMSTLLGVQFALCLIVQILFTMYFETKPKHPPSHAAKFIMMNSVDTKNENIVISSTPTKYNTFDQSVLKKEILTDNINTDDVHSSTVNQSKDIPSNSSVKHLLEELKLLINNKNYMILLLIFSFSIGYLCAFQILLFQLIDAYGYTNEDAGVLESGIVIAGVVGSILASIFMSCLKTYNTIFKIFQTCTFFCIIFFFYVLQQNQYYLVLISTCCIGFCIFPLVLINMELCAETTFPIQEDVSFGMLGVGGNIMGCLFVFLFQYLLTFPDVAFSYWYPVFNFYNIFLTIFETSSMFNKNKNIITYVTVLTTISRISIFTIILFGCMTILSFYFDCDYKRTNHSSVTSATSIDNNHNMNMSDTKYPTSNEEFHINNNSKNHHQHYNFHASFVLIPPSLEIQSR